MKIHVTGNAAAGKTTCAKALGQLLSLPVYHMDNVVWQSGWQKTPPEQREQLEQALVAKPTWVIEGVSTRVREEADIIVFLDTKRSICLRRGIFRTLALGFRNRPELPEGCPEIAILFKLIQIIWRFPRLIRTKLIEELQREPHRWLRFDVPPDAQSLAQQILASIDSVPSHSSEIGEHHAMADLHSAAARRALSGRAIHPNRSR